MKCGDVLFAGIPLVEVAILMAGATLEASLESGGNTMQNIPTRPLEDMEKYLQSNTSCHVRHVMYPSFDEIWPRSKCVSLRNEVVNGQSLFVILTDSGSLQVGDEAENSIFAEFVAGRTWPCSHALQRSSIWRKCQFSFEGPWHCHVESLK